MIIIGIIVAIIVFSIIILIHEYGHFKASRIFGVKVEEFGLGIPPKAKELFTDKKGTKYTLNWLPLGGFVRLKGENINTFRIFDENKILLSNQKLEKYIKENKDIYDENQELIEGEIKKEIFKKLEDNYASDSLLTKNPIKQAIIVLAGIFMNFLLAFFIFFILFLVGVKPVGINTYIETDLHLKLIPTLEDSIESGLLKQNDGVLFFGSEESILKTSSGVITSVDINGENILINDFKTLSNTLNSNTGSEITINGYNIDNTCNSGEECISKYLFEENIIIPETGKLGVYISPNYEVDENFEYKYGVLNSAKYAFLETKNQISFTFSGIKMLLGKIIFPQNEYERKEALEEVSGPIGMVDFMSKTVGNGVVYIFIIGALISINLGVFNLLPIPALDGGRFIFIVINGSIQKIFGKKAINENIEGMIHVLFFIFLIALSIIIAYNDVVKIINN